MANTQWVLTDLWNKQLFVFDTTNGWHPTNENQSPEITGDTFNIPWDNLVQKIDYGLGARQITLQGNEVADEDIWKLSSTVCKRQLMKLWVGEDWFYYVLGLEPRQIRDESLPVQKSYTVGLMAVDPHYHYAQSSTTIDTTQRKNLVVPDIERESGGVIDVVLSATGTNEGTTYVEPCFWIIGGASTSVTKVTIQDPLGRELAYTPTNTIENGDEHVIMPYRNTLFEGFLVNDATGFELTANGKTGTTAPSGAHASETAGDWQLDVFQQGAGTDIDNTAANNTYSWVTEENPCILSRNGTSYVEKNREYPRIEDGASGDESELDITYTGTSTDIAMYAQWCLRRV